MLVPIMLVAYHKILRFARKKTKFCTILSIIADYKSNIYQLFSLFKKNKSLHVTTNQITTQILLTITNSVCTFKHIEAR